MGIGKKLAWCFGGTLIATAVLGIVALRTISRISDELETTAKVTARKSALLADLKATVYSFRLAERGQLLFSQINAQDKVQSNHEAFGKATQASLDILAELQPMVSSDRGRQLIDDMATGVRKYISTQNGVWELIQQAKIQEAIQLDSRELVSTGAQIIAGITELQERQKELNAQAVERAEASQGAARGIVILVLFGCLAMGGVGAAVVARTTKALHAVATDMHGSAREIETAAMQLAAASDAFAQGASEQASSIEEASASTREISAMTQQNLEAARDAVRLMGEGDRVGQEVRSAVEAMAGSVNAIAESSEQVSRVVRVIDEIAFPDQYPGPECGR